MNPASERPARATAGRPRAARVLYAHNSSEIGGGNRVLLALIDHLPRDRFLPLSLVPRRGPLIEELRRRSVRVVRWDTLGPLRRATRAPAAAALLALAALLGWRRVDLLHANGPASYRLPSLALPGAARLCHLHLAPSAEALRWAFRRPPDRIVACSEAVRRQTVAHLDRTPLAGSLVVIPNAVDLERWSPPPAAAPSDQADPHGGLVLFCGSLGEHKGIDDFLGMAAGVLAARPESSFVVAGDDLVGDGAYRRRMEALARASGLGDRVRFTGFVADPRPLMQAADLVVLPSRSEGMPMALLEAAACAKPVVAYRIPSVDEVVIDGVDGRLLPVGDVGALTAAVLDLLSRPELAAAMGARGRQRVETHHSMGRYAARMEDVYRDLLLATRGRAEVARA
jgi:glycosyltransferase involved in cell wall biosynthesis